MTHILQLMAAQSAATIGSLTRAWLCVMATLWLPIGYMYLTHGDNPLAGKILQAVFVGGFASGVMSAPIMAVLVIIHIARKW
jgi:hypothetical protein